MSVAFFKPFLPVAALVLLSLSGCSRGKGPSMMVEMCLGSPKGVSLFVDTMRQIAASQHMTFIDNSARTRGELETVGQGKLAHQNPSTINIAIEGGDGLGVTAGNMGLSPYQVALGFTNGSDVAQGQRFSNAVIQTLGKQWKISKVPAGKGALPSKNCG